MKPDPKFGWHIIWLVPLVVAVAGYQQIAAHINNRRHNKKMNKILRESPEIKDPFDLAGIN